MAKRPSLWSAIVKDDDSDTGATYLVLAAWDNAVAVVPCDTAWIAVPVAERWRDTAGTAVAIRAALFGDVVRTPFGLMTPNGAFRADAHTAVQRCAVPLDSLDLENVDAVRAAIRAFSEEKRAAAAAAKPKRTKR